MSTKTIPHRDLEKEGKGWLVMIVIMFMFPALFYLCVFFPLWTGLTPRW